MNSGPMMAQAPHWTGDPLRLLFGKECRFVPSLLYIVKRKGKDVLLPYCKGVMLNPLPFHYRDGLGMGRESVLSRGAVTRSLGLLPPMVCV